mgnify:FL=1|tara:strand:+ start:3772 stop:4302 length:531 start_codon:yes stop_codon:yes gene_type:complete
MEFQKLKIKDLILFKPNKIEDHRGSFQESYNQINFNKIVGKNIEFVQDNFSVSNKGVFRGIHFQKKPYEQGKLVRVSLGRVIDFAVDLRKNSPTYLQWEKVELSDDNRFQLWIPEGFGHAFFTLSDVAHFCYKTTNFYNKDSEECIIWNDPSIGISFNKNNIEMIISDKDLKGKLL